MPSYVNFQHSAVDNDQTMMIENGVGDEDDKKRYLFKARSTV